MLDFFRFKNFKGCLGVKAREAFKRRFLDVEDGEEESQV